MLSREGSDPSGDITPDEVAEFFEAREAITFAALAKREFFNSVTGYVNSSNFGLIIQKYSSQESQPDPSYTITRRKRDGSVTTTFSASACDTRCPRARYAREGFARRPAIASAVLTGMRTRPNLDEAVFAFNAANTDGNQIRPEFESVLMVGAFEAPLDGRRGVEESLGTLYSP